MAYRSLLFSVLAVSFTASGVAQAEEDPKAPRAPYHYKRIGKTIYDISSPYSQRVDVDVNTTTNSVAVRTSCVNEEFHAYPGFATAVLDDGTKVELREVASIANKDGARTWYFSVAKLQVINISKIAFAASVSSHGQALPARCAIYVYDHRLGLRKGADPTPVEMSASINLAHPEAVEKCLARALQAAFVENDVDDTVVRAKLRSQPTIRNGCYPSQFFNAKTKKTTYTIALDVIRPEEYCWQEPAYDVRSTWHMSSLARLLRSADGSWQQDLLFDVQFCWE